MKPRFLFVLLVCSSLASQGVAQKRAERRVDLYPATFILPLHYFYKDLHGTDTYEGVLSRKDSCFHINLSVGNLIGNIGDPSIRKKFYWYQEQKINGNEVHLAKEKVRGVDTFWATIVAPASTLHYRQRANISFRITSKTNVMDALFARPFAGNR